MRYIEMKAILEFDRYEDGDEFDDAVNGGKYHFILYEMDEWLRGRIKHGDDEKTCEVLEKARDQLHEIVDRFGVRI
jgi:hypothetical protein